MCAVSTPTVQKGGVYHLKSYALKQLAENRADFEQLKWCFLKILMRICNKSILQSFHLDPKHSY